MRKEAVRPPTHRTFLKQPKLLINREIGHARDDVLGETARLALPYLW
jgi:hypothetical protein